MTSIRNLVIALRPISWASAFIICFTSLSVFSAASSGQEIEADLARIHQIPPQSEDVQSPAERKEAEAIVSRLNRADQHQLANAVTDAIRNAKTGREVADYASLMPRILSIKSEILQKIGTEPDPVLKSRLINSCRYVKGADVLKALISQLDDKRAADSEQPGYFGFRVCDWAFNVIYMRLSNIPELGMDTSTAKSDSISHNVPIDWRDARIGKLKTGLTKKFGPGLHLPDQL